MNSTLTIDTNSYVFDGSDWSKQEGLSKKKYVHRSIIIGQAVYHIGSWDSSGGEGEYIEKWEIGNLEKSTKQLLNVKMSRPEVFVVSADFCGTL